MERMKARSVAVTKVLAVVMALGVFAAVTPAAQAADAERIQFPNDTIEVNLERTVPANGAKRFVFGAKEGQEVSLTVTPKTKGAALNVNWGNDPRTIPLGKLFTVRIAKTGDFQIQVSNFDDVNRSFTLDLGVAFPPKKAAPAGAERIEFSKDIIEVNLEKTIAANTKKRFSFSAKQGQEISLTVTSKVPSALLVDLVGKIMTQAKDVRDGKLFVMKVDKSDDFEIRIVNLANISRSYNLDLGVADAPKKADPAGAERIQFSKDIIEVNLEKTVPANGAKRFVFSAKEGQGFALTVTPKVKGATLAINLGNTTVTPGKLYSFKATRAGDFHLQVTNSDDVNRGFYLDLGVTGP